MAVLTYPHPILRRRAKPVAPGSPEARKVAAALREEFSSLAAHGLAANQIGLPLRAVLVRLGGEERILLNPEIVARSAEVEVDWEGCLSLPGVEAEVPRAKGVRVRAVGEDGSPVELALSDLEARVLQHEVDHLDGVLYVDLLSQGRRRAVLAAYRRAREGAKEKVPSAG